MTTKVEWTLQHFGALEKAPRRCDMDHARLYRTGTGVPKAEARGPILYGT
jgi:hypothetical protein